jgi:hypothetical protein
LKNPCCEIQQGNKSQGKDFAEILMDLLSFCYSLTPYPYASSSLPALPGDQELFALHWTLVLSRSPRRDGSARVATTADVHGRVSEEVEDCAGETKLRDQTQSACVASVCV